MYKVVKIVYTVGVESKNYLAPSEQNPNSTLVVSGFYSVKTSFNHSLTLEQDTPFCIYRFVYYIHSHHNNFHI